MTCGNCGTDLEWHCERHLVPCCPGRCPADRRNVADYTIESVARELASLPSREARLEFSRLVDTAWQAPDHEFPLRLDFNARLATLLRQLKVTIWGALETTAWDGPD